MKYQGSNLKGGYAYITVVRGWHNIFQLLPIEDINSHKVAFCMAMLPSLGGGNLHNLAGPPLDDDVAVLPDRSGLLRVRLRRPGVGLRLEVVLLVRHVS